MFGTDSSRYPIVARYFAAFPHFSLSDDFVIICGDLTVKLVPDTVSSTLDPRGIWNDDVHGWSAVYDQFNSCDYTRKSDVRLYLANAFTVMDRLIYVCPSVLDNIKGRLLASYKDQLLVDHDLEDYGRLLPRVLLHELYHTHVVSPPPKCSVHTCVVFSPRTLSFHSQHHVII